MNNTFFTQVFSNINCPLKLKYAYMYFYFNPFSVTMYHYTSMHTHICTHVSDARAVYIMQIDFAEFCRGQSVTAAKHA